MSYISRMVVVSMTTVAALLGSAVESRAGLLDYIWDTSGPPFLGVVFRCRQAPTFGRTIEPAEAQDFTMRCDPLLGRTLRAPGQKLWVSMEAGFYVQGGKDGKAADGSKIAFGPLNGVAMTFEPMIEFRVLPTTWRVSHGVGATSIAIASTDFPRTGNLGYKIRMVAVELPKGVSVSANLRIFPDGFTDYQFGVGPLPTGDPGKELSFGFSLGL